MWSVGDDFERLEAWRAGDRAAGEALFQRHFERIRRFFANKSPAHTEDLVQRTFLACVEARDRFRGASSFRTFVLAVARNVLRDFVRERQRDLSVSMATVTAADLGPSPSSEVAAQEAAKELLLALRRIPLDLQIALELFYWEQLQSSEIAEVLEIPHGTVRSRLRRARDLLGQELEQLTQRPWDDKATIGSLESWVRDIRRQR